MPKFLFDENMGKTVTEHFLSAGHDVVSVSDVLRGAPDTEVLKHAVKEERVLVTLDKDFAELIFHSGLPHSGIVLLRLQSLSSKNIIAVFGGIIDTLPNTSQKKFIVISEDKIRVR
jgi:predicted nuclease of predicted toxin-antitoxin system